MLSCPDHRVAQFRDILIWPVQIRPGFSSESIPRIHQQMTAGGQWRLLDDEFPDDPADFQERHYKEFVAFLPYVQRFLYGEGVSGAEHTPGRSAPVTVYRRTDVDRLRITLRPDSAPIELQVAHVNLYFFLDMDVALLNVEVAAENLPLATAHELLYRFGRAYPTGWDQAGQGLHNPARATLLDRQGRELAKFRPGQQGPLPRICMPPPGPLREPDVVLAAPALRARPRRHAGRAALPTHRVLPDAAHGLSGPGEPPGPHPG